MAQAARLNLRMQKELKLLLRDPPPRASFPFLSAAAESSTTPSVSLSSIDALIEGPEGTVYEKGVFHIKIQIPECYPFQPPIVTFGTPIYHPNIDTGGRICLDILNLPPKGAWQPSLNISTVLTSIGLLLSEPNPDDGLMCEASNEYKYNRQIFDQKARSMTEKYAKAGASSQSMLTSSRPSMMETKRTSQEQKCEVIGQTSSQKTSLGLSRKLSLDLSGSKKKMGGDGKFSEELNHLMRPTSCEKEVQIEGTQNESGGIVNCYNLTTGKLSITRQKLSLNCSGQSQKKDVLSQENVLANTHPYARSPQIDSMACLKTTSVQIANKQVEHKSLSLSSKKLCQVSQQPSMRDGDNIDRDNDKHHLTREEFHPIAESRHGLNDIKSAKPYSTSRKLSLGHKRPLQKDGNDNKENVITRDGNDKKLSFESLIPFEERNDKENDKCDANSSSKSRPKSHDSGSKWKMMCSKDHEKRFSGKIKKVEPENSVMADTMIVLDSEDSEEERNNDSSPKLLIARKPLARKRRVKA